MFACCPSTQAEKGKQDEEEKPEKKGKEQPKKPQQKKDETKPEVRVVEGCGRG